MYNGLHFCFCFIINETNREKRINGEYYWGCLHERYFACNDHIYLVRMEFYFRTFVADNLKDLNS